MSIKPFLKVWGDKKELKDLDKGERCNHLYNELENIINFFLFKRYKEKENLDAMYDIFTTPKFIKTLNKVVKDAGDEWMPDAAICLVISDFLSLRGNTLDEDMKETYVKIVKTLTETPLKKIKKNTNLTDDVALSIVSVIPSKGIVKDQKYVGRYIQSLEKALYACANVYNEDKEYVGMKMEDFTEKTLKELIKLLFDKEYKNAILMAIALDRRSNMKNFSNNQLSVWNVFTYYLSQEIDSMDKSDIKAFLEIYVDSRSRDYKEGKDSARRINFSQVLADDSEKLHKVISKLIDKDKDEKYKKFL